MKIKFLTLLLLCTSVTFSQTKKKKKVVKKATTTVVKPTVAQNTASTDGIFAEMETSKGKIWIQLL